MFQLQDTLKITFLAKTVLKQCKIILLCLCQGRPSGPECIGCAQGQVYSLKTKACTNIQ